MRGVIQNHRLLILPDEPIVFVVDAFPLANETTNGNIARWLKDSASPTRMILEINGSATIERCPNELLVFIVEPLAARGRGVELHRTATYAGAVAKFLNEIKGVDILAHRPQCRVVVREHVTQCPIGHGATARDARQCGWPGTKAPTLRRRRPP